MIELLGAMEADSPELTDAGNWVVEEMRAADFGDKRLRRRLHLILRRMYDSPAAGLKGTFKGWGELIGAYRFFDNDRVDEAAILQPHHEATLERVRAQSKVLVLQDTTELDYSTKKALQGTGHLSVEVRQGFFLHSQYVVTPERLPLGFWGAKIYAREKAAEDKKEKDPKSVPIQDKETIRWLEGYQDACCLAELAPETRVVSISDREGDIYDTFVEWQRRRDKGERVAEWLIRSCHDRCLEPFQESQADTAGLAPPRKLRAAVEQSPVLGTIDFYVARHVGVKKTKDRRGVVKKVRNARHVKQELRAIEVTLKAPRRGCESFEPVKISVVMAREINPPAGENPIQWVLLTSLPVKNFEAAQEVLELYLARWEIEIFHRVLKIGCMVEKMQLKEDERMKPAIAAYMIVAWRVLYIMKLGRECPNFPCDLVFEEAEWQAVYHIVHGEPAVEKPTLGEMVTMVGSLGGHTGRKGDGPPGPQCMWRGIARTRDFALAWLMFKGKAQRA